MKHHKQLLLANSAWAAEQRDDDPQFFLRQVEGQRPPTLWIGCSDSRVAPDQITQSAPGSLFIHRNIANLVSADDLNLMSVVQYAVSVLKVTDIVVCGHHGCGGMIATLDGGTEGPIDHWLETARKVYRNHAHEIDGPDEREAQVNRLVECNVRDQLLNMARTPPVQAAFAEGRALHLHGWVYDLRDGLLKPLLEIDATTDLADIGAPDRVLT